MIFEEFKNALLENLDLPFEISEVAELQSNCGSTWLTLRDGRSFFITIEQCEGEKEDA